MPVLGESPAFLARTLLPILIRCAVLLNITWSETAFEVIWFCNNSVYLH